MSDELTDRERHMLESWIAVEPPPDFADRVIALAPGRRWLPYAIGGSAAVAAAALLLVLRTDGVVERAPIVQLPVAPAIAPIAPVAPAPELTIDPEAAPARDLDLEVGQSATIFAATGEVTLNFYTRSCKSGLQVELGPGPGREWRVDQGVFGVVLPISRGRWTYRASCMVGGMPEPTFVSGQLDVVRGTAYEPKPPDEITLRPDGRLLQIVHRHDVPALLFERPAGGEVFHFGPEGNVQRQGAGRGHHLITNLADGRYQFWFTRGDQLVGERTTFVLASDSTVPAINLKAPLDGAPATSPIVLRGTVLPGWTVRVEATTIPTALLQFEAEVPLRPGIRSLAVRLDHPQHGTQYVLRRLR